MNSAAALLRALRGPVMLITLGCLFLLRFDGPGWSIKTTWPLLIIVFGLMKLFESLAGRSPSSNSGGSL
jgi:hypothetical protein